MSTKVPFAKKIDIRTTDNSEGMAVFIETTEGPVSFALKNKELSKLVALFLHQSDKVAAHYLANNLSEDAEAPQNVTLNPVLVNGLGLAPGRSEETTMLLAKVGNLTLAFEPLTSVLRDTLMDLDNLADLEKPQRTH